MRRIFKYELSVVDNLIIALPKGAKILCVQTQYEKPVMYAIVNDEAPKENRSFEIYGTGHSMGNIDMSTREYVGTFQLYGGNLVFHLFELIM